MRLVGLGQEKENPDADPDEHESNQHPEEESGLPDRQPGELLPGQEEARSTSRAMNVDVDNLSAHGRGRVRCEEPFGIAISSRSATPENWVSSRHPGSVPPARHGDTLPAQTTQLPGGSR